MKKFDFSSYLICALLAGIAVTMQNSLNGLMTPIVGAMGASFVGFTVQAVILFGIMTVRKEKISIRKIPFWCYAGGLLASINVATLGYCVSITGSAVSTCCSVTGQILFSAIIDHFGLFGNQKRPFSTKRMPGFLLILAGILSMNLIGSDSSQSVSLLILLLAIGLGFLTIIIRTLNYKTSEHTGSTLTGGMINSISGCFFGLIFYLLLSGFNINWSLYGQVPVLCYFAGAFGVCSLLLNILAYKGKNIFYSTIFMLFGQVTTSILMDLLVFHALSVGKLIGVLIVMAGVVLDKYMTK